VGPSGTPGALTRGSSGASSKQSILGVSKHKITILPIVIGAINTHLSILEKGFALWHNSLCFLYFSLFTALISHWDLPLTSLLERRSSDHNPRCACLFCMFDIGGGRPADLHVLLRKPTLSSYVISSNAWKVPKKIWCRLWGETNERWWSVKPYENMDQER